MTSKYFRLAIAGLLVLSLAASLFARGQFWDFLGDAQVDNSRGRSWIQVTRRDVHSRTIQLRVSGEAIFFDRLVVHFVDGTSQELVVSGRILPGTRNFALLRECSLESIELLYYKEAWGKTPRVTLYGVRSEEQESNDPDIVPSHQR